ncbi:YDG/SRA domain-containing protein [Streptomyces sp. NBC_01016]|uniref:YDG/SRA domain-containing protein n=1 Tax=Streptomyces sp. NBC_01016 TaxID=2903720 RepID=UPI002B1D3FFB|nr:YDG/SRA domain-containing protein [Streptomyces sp. NBC_01016]
MQGMPWQSTTVFGPEVIDCSQIELEVAEVHAATCQSAGMPTSSRQPSKSIYFGPPPEVSPGQWFKGHTELHAAGVHRFRGRGISGTAREGVDSIVASGGYAADSDEGDVVIYTAMGGDPDKDGHITTDQRLDGCNAGLVLNQNEGLPVRYVRGLDIRSGKARGGYRYAGLYRVEGHWCTQTARGHLMWQFRLVRDLGESVPGDVEVELDPDMTELERATARYVTSQRRVRNTRASRKVKSIYANTCQVCRVPVVVGVDGERYSEGAHIQALGEPHHGPDVASNILCLCPNCHVRFDNGALLITDDLDIVDGFTRQVVGRLYVERPRHRIGVAFLKQHRSRWADRSQGL